MNEFVIVTNVG